MNLFKQNQIDSLVNQIACNCGLLSFPIKICPIMNYAVKKCDGELYFIPYSEFADTINTNVDGIALMLGTYNAKIINKYPFNTYFIYYNDIYPKYRIRWNILHELGHFFLEHPQEKANALKHNLELSKLRIKEMEEEANYFTKALTAPLSVVIQFLYYYQMKNFEGAYVIFRSIFKLSQESSYYYASDIIRQGTINVDINTVKPFMPFIKDFIKTYDFNAMNILRKKYESEIPSVKTRIIRKMAKLPSFTMGKAEKIDNILFEMFNPKVKII